MAGTNRNLEIVIVPGSSLSQQPWWPELHAVILESYRVKNSSVFPLTWTRLNVDPAKGAESLANELGKHGHFAIAFTDERQPIACGGVLPFRGENWINDAFNKTDAELVASQRPLETYTDWEVCCFCVHPSARGQGVSSQLLDELSAFLKAKGGERLFTGYARDETGQFWPRLGFEVVPGAGGLLRKGFRRDPDEEGLKEDIHFLTGVKVL